MHVTVEVIILPASSVFVIVMATKVGVSVVSVHCVTPSVLHLTASTISVLLYSCALDINSVLKLY